VVAGLSAVAMLGVCADCGSAEFLDPWTDSRSIAICKCSAADVVCHKSHSLVRILGLLITAKSH